MFDRISNSFALARSSWQVLRTDKQLIVFPILSGIGCYRSYLRDASTHLLGVKKMHV